MPVVVCRHVVNCIAANVTVLTGQSCIVLLLGVQVSAKLRTCLGFIRANRVANKPLLGQDASYCVAKKLLHRALAFTCNKIVIDGQTKVNLPS